jgi:hypothetical protein
MSRKLAFSVLAFFAAWSPCLAQTDAAPAARNALFFELLGNGGVYSFNFERLLTDRLGVRLGYATWKSSDFFPLGSEDQYTAWPVTVSYLMGRGERKFELGGGITFGQVRPFSFTRRDFSFHTLTAIVGYRSHPPDGGYLFRVGVTPFYSFEDSEKEAYPDPGFTFSAGVSFGYLF